MQSKGRTKKRKLPAWSESERGPVEVLLSEFEQMDAASAVQNQRVRLSRQKAKSIAARMLRAAERPEKIRIDQDVDSLLGKLRSDATADIVDELASAIEDYGKTEYDGGYHEGYDRGCDEAANDES